MRITSLGDVAKAALYLAMSDDISEERRIKETLLNCGWRSVATEVGGISGDLSMKVSRALVGAALNSGVVRKSTSEMHALLHAAQEAF
ncbi:MAG: hut operon positive regulator HutP, partial [Pyramidobacter sp.]|nr:hut operon positive regulator HutP [Pyramidobacter sp.]